MWGVIKLYNHICCTSWYRMTELENGPGVIWRKSHCHCVSVCSLCTMSTRHLYAIRKKKIKICILVILGDLNYYIKASIVLVGFQKGQHFHSRYQKTTSNLLRISLGAQAQGLTEFLHKMGAMYITQMGEQNLGPNRSILSQMGEHFSTKPMCRLRGTFAGDEKYVSYGFLG